MPTPFVRSLLEPPIADTLAHSLAGRIDAYRERRLLVAPGWRTSRPNDAVVVRSATWSVETMA